MTHDGFSRREALLAAGGAFAAARTAPARQPIQAPPTTDGPRVVVIGAGAFGGWTALWLLRGGARVTLVDAWGPGNSRASSGGESRLIRAAYGTRRIYSEMVKRALEIWREHQAGWNERIFRDIGMLRMAGEDRVESTRASAAILRELGLAVEEFTPDELARRYPQISTDGIVWALLEKDAGYLLARRGCQRVFDTFVEEGGEARLAFAAPGAMQGGRMSEVGLSDGSLLEADEFVFAGGPWLAELFPGFDPPLVRPTRQEVFYFGPPAGRPDLTDAGFPGWIDNPFYGIPGNTHRGLKIADDRRGEPFDPTHGDRTPSEEGIRAAREYMERRFPAMRGAPLLEARVCQYEQSADANLIVDTHPEADNVWIAGGGSGHGYKLGAALGEMLAEQILGQREKEPFFSLARFAA